MKSILFRSAIYAVTGTLLFFGMQNFKSTAQGLLPGIIENEQKPLQQRISTDKHAYSLNENVLIKGNGFTAFEPVRITINQVEPAVYSDFPVSEWLVYADFDGTFNTIWTVGTPGTRFGLRAAGVFSKEETDVIYIVMHVASLDQCSNGTFDLPLQCVDPNWVNGNLNGNQAHYMEGESVPYRLAIDGMTAGVEHTVTIEWDFTQSGLHAIDYLTSFNRNETDANPCSGIAGCDPASFSTIPIPLDPNVVNGDDGIAGNADDIAQAPGVFTLYGGTLASVSNYMVVGSLVGNSSVSVTITFTPTVTHPVLAWGGHVSRRADWGTTHSSLSITGSPFHMRLIEIDGSGGNQDRSLHSDAVFFPGEIVIIKDAQPDTTQLFGFTAVGPQMTNFTLDDDGVNSNTYSNTQNFTGLTNFGAGHQVTITENASSPYYLVSLECVSDPNGGDGVDNNTITLAARQVVITLEEGEIVTCTYANARPTATTHSISGMVYGTSGRGLANAGVSVTKVSTGEVLYWRTNSFGNFTVSGLDAGEDYIIRVRAKGTVFDPDSILVNLAGDLVGVTFAAQQGP